MGNQFRSIKPANSDWTGSGYISYKFEYICRAPTSVKSAANIGIQLSDLCSIKMDFIQKISRITLFIFCIHCVGGQFLNESSECNTMNDKHWNLIHWFYGKTNHICVTFIANAPGENHQLRMQDTILHGLFESTGYCYSDRRSVAGIRKVENYLTSD